METLFNIKYIIIGLVVAVLLLMVMVWWNKTTIYSSGYMIGRRVSKIPIWMKT
jgi:hypothetical protein